VRLFELGHDDEGLYFTMEPIDGVQLDDYLQVGQPAATAATAEASESVTLAAESITVPVDERVTRPSRPWWLASRPELDVLLPRLAPVVRASVRARQAEPERRRRHDVFAAQLAEDDTVAPERIVRHLVSAGRLIEAGPRALDAAERARARFARGLAIEMYRVALAAAADPGEYIDVLRRMASCLDDAARYREAAARWRELGALVPPDERAEAAVYEAASLLGAADVVAGYARLDEATRQLGVAPLHARGPGAILDGLRFLRGPWRPRRPMAAQPIADATRRRLDRDLHLAMFASYFDPLTGVRLLLRARDASRALGAAEDTAIAEYLLAFMAYFSSGTRGPVRAAERWRAAADARVAHLVERRADTRSYPQILDGVARFRAGDFTGTTHELEKALTTLEAGGIHGTLEHLYVLVLRCASELAQQRLATFADQYRRLVAAFSEGGGSTVRAQVGLLGAFEAFLRGDLAGMRDQVRAFGATWPAEPPTAQRSLFTLLETVAAIDEIEPAELRRRRQAALAGDRRFRLLRSMDSGFYWAGFALIEARAILDGDPAASRREVHRFAARALAAPPLGTSRALRSCAYVASDRARAIALLVAAEKEAARWGQPIDVAVARHMRGKRLGGNEGAALVASARDMLAAAGAPGHWLGEDEV